MIDPKKLVPSHCTGIAFAFDPGTLHVAKDGSATLIIPEDEMQFEDDRCEGPDGPEGSVHWAAKLAPSEVIALRNFLNGVDNRNENRLATVPEVEVKPLGRVLDCPLCDGTGVENIGPIYTCVQCGGSGQVDGDGFAIDQATTPGE